MKLHFAGFILIALWVFSACKADVCPPESITYVPDAAALPDSASVLESAPEGGPFTVQLGKKTIEVDRVVHGPLCNDHWSGTVYVGCDVEIVAWTEEEGSNFLENCELVIEPGTVVYVAAHNNAAYYKGCASCHGGVAEMPAP
ncbi:MAG: hypothetical protein RBT75_09380 [Anaerolineae bacterium]|jgi:hypothetical protein|nr:hypothetical protein [Anaerolineae bacterium]